jgi:hypothetical protein
VSNRAAIGGFVESVEQFVSEASGEPAATGDIRVDSVLEALAELTGAGMGEQVAVYDRVHRGLQDCLTEAAPAAVGSARPG